MPSEQARGWAPVAGVNGTERASIARRMGDAWIAGCGRAAPRRGNAGYAVAVLAGSQTTNAML